MYLDMILRATELAGIGQHPFEQFRPMVPDVGGRIADGCIRPPDEWHATPHGKEWLLPFACDRDAENLSRSPLRCDDGSRLGVQVTDTYEELIGEVTRRWGTTPGRRRRRRPPLGRAPPR
jgi:hypothetical protein